MFFAGTLPVTVTHIHQVLTGRRHGPQLFVRVRDVLVSTHSTQYQLLELTRYCSRNSDGLESTTYAGRSADYAWQILINALSIHVCLSYSMQLPAIRLTLYHRRLISLSRHTSTSEPCCSHLSHYPPNCNPIPLCHSLGLSPFRTSISLMFLWH